MNFYELKTNNQNQVELVRLTTWQVRRKLTDRQYSGEAC